MGKSKFMRNAVIAGAVGGVVAWLMTTERGRQVRERLQSELLDEADRLLGSLENKLGNWTQEALSREEEEAGG